MGVFYHQESPTHPPTKRHNKCLASTLKEVFSQCRNFTGRLSTASEEDFDFPISHFAEEQEVKKKKKENFALIDLCFESFFQFISP